MNDSFGTLKSALGGFDLFARDVGGFAVGPEFLQASDNDFRQVALLVALGDLDRFFNVAFSKRRRPAEQRHETACGQR